MSTLWFVLWLVTFATSLILGWRLHRSNANVARLLELLEHPPQAMPPLPQSPEARHLLGRAWLTCPNEQKQYLMPVLQVGALIFSECPGCGIPTARDPKDIEWRV